MNSLTDISQLIGVLGSIVSIIIAIFFYIFSKHKRKDKLKEHIITEGNNSPGKVGEIYQAGRDMSVFENEIEKLEGIDDKKFSQDYIVKRIQKLESAFNKLQKLLFDNPEATISIPLMKKDMDSFSREINYIHKEIDKVNSSTKWFIGIIISMLIGLFGLALSIILKG